MNTDEQVARMQEWLGTHPASATPRDAASFEDEDTLRRSFGGLSKFARREQRRIGPTRVDEYGYDRSGHYYPAADGAA